MPKERYFNYCLSRVILLSKWRILMRKCESKKETVKLRTLVCVCLHNLFIELNDLSLTNWDLSKVDRKIQEEIQEILTMINCTRTRDIRKEAKRILEILKKTFRAEKVPNISIKQNENFLRIFK